VDGEINEAYSCNCSVCSRRGSMLWFTTRENFRLLRGDEDLTTYTFNKQVIHHKFCRHCGIQGFALGVGPDGRPMSAINIRTLEDFDFEKVPVTRINGKDF